MSHKLLCINVQGKHSRWGFSFYGDPKHIEAWRADGLDVFEVRNTVPGWVAVLGLARPWCFVQDVFNLRNPFAK